MNYLTAEVLESEQAKRNMEGIENEQMVPEMKIENPNNSIELKVFQELEEELYETKVQIKRIKKKWKKGKIEENKAKRMIKKLRHRNKKLKHKMELQQCRDKYEHQMELQKCHHNYEMQLVRIKSEAACSFMAMLTAIPFPKAREEIVQQCTKEICRVIADHSVGGDSND